jgi:hypothetical protein
LSIAARRIQRSQKATGGLPDGGYLTIMFGRTNYQALVGGAPVGGKTKTIFDAANALKSRGLSACGGVVINRTEETNRKIISNYYSSVSWGDMANLRDNYGWQFVSQGMTYANMTTMANDTERYNESGATLPIFESHGHDNAWGMFCYPNDLQNADSMRVVTKYFAFGRKYSDNTNTSSSATPYPYKAYTKSINGGRCNNTSLTCNTMTILPHDRLTDSPEVIAAHMSPPPGQWNIIQFYRFVDGTNGTLAGGTRNWDCSSADWRDRWTGTGELYPWKSFLEALDLRTTRATCVHPAEMANMWGRGPISPHG